MEKMFYDLHSVFRIDKHFKMHNTTIHKTCEKVLRLSLALASNMNVEKFHSQLKSHTDFKSTRKSDIHWATRFTHVKTNFIWSFCTRCKDSLCKIRILLPFLDLISVDRRQNQLCPINIQCNTSMSTYVIEPSSKEGNPFEEPGQPA